MLLVGSRVKGPHTKDRKLSFPCTELVKVGPHSHGSHRIMALHYWLWLSGLRLIKSCRATSLTCFFYGSYIYPWETNHSKELRLKKKKKKNRNNISHEATASRSVIFITDEIQDLASLCHGSNTVSLHPVMFLITTTQDSFTPVVKMKNKIAIIPLPSSNVITQKGSERIMNYSELLYVEVDSWSDQKQEIY